MRTDFSSLSVARSSDGAVDPDSDEDPILSFLSVSIKTYFSVFRLSVHITRYDDVWLATRLDCCPANPEYFPRWGVYRSDAAILW